jgi:lysophospholipase L1-like esterase
MALCCLAAAQIPNVTNPVTGRPVQSVAVQELPAGSDIEKLKTELTRNRKTLDDWANLGRYAANDDAMSPPSPSTNRVVFMGDSITDAWGRQYGTFFAGKSYVNRGISGQTTPQMLVRFRPDVIDLKPSTVVILAGTNDIAGNTGPETLKQIEGYLQSMAELAKANGIKVVLASVMPVCDYIQQQTTKRPPDKIKQLNAWISAYCEKNGLVYLDYFTAMVDDKGFFKKELTYDGLHPNNEGYKVMEPLAQEAIAKALAQ